MAGFKTKFVAFRVWRHARYAGDVRVDGRSFRRNGASLVLSLGDVDLTATLWTPKDDPELPPARTVLAVEVASASDRDRWHSAMLAELRLALAGWGGYNDSSHPDDLRRSHDEGR